MASKPHIDKDAILGCMFDNTVYCNTQVYIARSKGRRYNIRKFRKGGKTGGKIR